MSTKGKHKHGNEQHQQKPQGNVAPAKFGRPIQPDKSNQHCSADENFATTIREIPNLSGWRFLTGIKFTDVGMLLATVVIAWATVAYTSYAGKQWGTMQRQLTDYEIKERGRMVAIMTPHITEISPNAGALVDWNIQARNVGGSVVSEIAIDGSLAELVSPSGQYAETPGSTPDLSPRPVPNGPSLAQGERFEFQRRDQIGWWQETLDGKTITILRMKVSYRDIFGQNWAVPACVYYSAINNRFLECPGSNQQGQNK
jgi:hypothetical protein